MSDLAGQVGTASTVSDRPSSVSVLSGVGVGRADVAPGRHLWVSAVNWTFTLLALPSLLGAALLLLILNPRYNPGPLIFRQERAGRDGRIFRIYKFRTMAVASDDGSACIEAHKTRITPLGKILRKYRVDELPNFINVALGAMNVIGPRPDARVHAEAYVDKVPGYQERFAVKPGITGLAQVVHGYAACADSTRTKARYDRFYVRHRGVRLDAFIVLRTLQVMLSGFGSR